MEPTDEELNTLILARLAIIGVDLSVLPVSDPSAPAEIVVRRDRSRAHAVAPRGVSSR